MEMKILDGITFIFEKASKFRRPNRVWVETQHNEVSIFNQHDSAIKAGYEQNEILSMSELIIPNVMKIQDGLLILDETTLNIVGEFSFEGEYTVDSNNNIYAHPDIDLMFDNEHMFFNGGYDDINEVAIALLLGEIGEQRERFHEIPEGMVLRSKTVYDEEEDDSYDLCFLSTSNNYYEVDELHVGSHKFSLNNYTNNKFESERNRYLIDSEFTTVTVVNSDDLENIHSRVYSFSKDAKLATNLVELENIINEELANKGVINKIINFFK